MPTIFKRASIGVGSQQTNLELFPGKVCTVCGEWNYLENYAQKASQCVACDKIRFSAIYKKNRDYYRTRNITRDGNLRLRLMDRLSRNRASSKMRGYVGCNADVEEILSEYTETCQICSLTVGRGIHLDHCHTTGKFRGWIRADCNHLLGNCRESIDTLTEAINYLQKHNQ